MAIGKTPAAMIMGGILQVREKAMIARLQGDYYTASWLYADMAALLPVEAYKAGFVLTAPPKMGDYPHPTVDLNTACRKYIEENVLNYHQQIPKYVYGFFERNRKIKKGY